MLRSAMFITLVSMLILACGLYVGDEDKDLDKKHRAPCGDPDGGGPVPDAGIDWTLDASPGGWPDAGFGEADAGYNPLPDAGLGW